VAGPPASEGVQWQPDLKTAHKAALAQNKPILLVFGAEWCTYCHKLERNVINQPEMAAYINETFVPVHLDADHDKKVADILQVQGLPCTVVITPNAQLLGRFTGYSEAAAYEKKLASTQEKFEAIQTAARSGETVTR
jgi:uncharacterized protein YyaL (SSP411 family)